MSRKEPPGAGTGTPAIIRDPARVGAKFLAARSFDEGLEVIAEQLRLLVGAHQSAVSYVPDGEFEAACHANSLSEKYEKYRTYDVMPTGKGIWAVLVERRTPMRLTHEELLAHTRWKNFSALKDTRGLEHPPMRGWLAVPVLRRDGGFLGVLQLSDKFEGEFTESDEEVLTRLARLVAPTFELEQSRAALVAARDEALALQEELKFVSEHAPASIARCDSKGRYRFVNQVYADLFGMRPEDIVGKAVREVLGEETYSQASPHMDSALAGRTAEHDLTLPVVGGGARTVHVSYAPDRDALGGVIGVIAAGFDITERKDAEAALRVSEAFSRRIIESSHECIKVLDLHGRLLSMSRGGQRLLEIEDLSLYLNEPWAELWEGKARESAAEAVANAVRGDTTSFRGYCPTARGISKWWEVIVSPLEDADGSVDRVLAVSRDVTERRQAEEAMLRLNTELEVGVRQRTAELEDANRALAAEVAERLRAERILDATSDIVWMADPSGRLLYLNRGGHTALGVHDEDDLSTINVADFHARPEAELLATDAFASAERHGNWAGELSFSARGGRAFPTSAVLLAHRSASEDTEFFSLIARDISALKEAQGRLEEQRSNLLRAQQVAHMGFLDFDLVSNTIEWSDEVYRLYRVNPETDTTDPQFTADMVHPDDQPRARANLERATQGLGSEEIDHRVVRPDGSVIWVHAQMELLRDADGAPARLLGTVVDVTALKHAEENMRCVLETAPDAMIVTNESGTITFVNDRLLVLFGYRRGELVGRPVEVLVPERHRGAHRGHRTSFYAAPTARLMGTGPVVELHAVDKSGREFPVEIALTPLETTDGKLVSATVRDVRERRRLDALRLRSRELEAQNTQIQEGSRLKGEFVAHMSHELRTPLNAILGFAQLMHEGKLGPVSAPHKEYLGDIISSSRHLMELINDTLDLAKVESGKMEFRPQEVDLGALVSDVLEILRGLAAAKQIEVTSDVAEELCNIYLDPARIRQVLYNYLSNAIKFTARNGAVAVRVRPDTDGAFRVEVQDTGIGIADSDQPRVFDEFTQIDSGYAKEQPGSGLGLAVTKRMVEAQGGAVGVESVVGEGSTFWARLPCRAGASSVEGGRCER